MALSTSSETVSCTDMAIDWALSCADDMYGFVGGDAAVLADLAINAVESMRDPEDDLEFDEASIERAIEARFSEIQEDAAEDDAAAPVQ